MPKHDLTKLMSVAPELIGLETLLTPTPQHTSSPRSAMVSGHLVQAITPHGAEFPMWFTGIEEKVGRHQYLFDRAELKERSIIKRVIAKQLGPSAKVNPATTVICVGCETGEINYFDINKYTPLGRLFGVRNRLENAGLLFPDTPVDAGVEFAIPPNKDEELYSMGVNANAMYATLPATNEDAVLISESFAKKLAYTKLKTSTVVVDSDSIPLNLYGDTDTYRPLPDIDELVRRDGVLVGVRTLSDDCFMADLTDHQLQTPQVHDHLVNVDQAAKIVNIEVYFGHEFRYEDMENPVYKQLMEYYEQSVRYHATVLDAYYDLKDQGYPCNPKMNDLVTYSLAMLGIANKRKKIHHLCSDRVRQEVNKLFGKRGRQTITCFDKKNSIDYVQIIVTYAYTEHVSVGSKITNRHGNKGCISDIWPDVHMPIDANGLRAHVVICPRCGCNRLNPGQWNEQYFGRCAEIILKNARMIDDAKAAFNYIVDFFHTLNPIYADIVKSTVDTEEKVVDYLAEVEEEGRLHYQIPQFTKQSQLEVVRALREKYNITKTPVEFYTNADSSDGVFTKQTSKVPIMIGSEYWFILGKIPKDQVNAVEAAWVNQHMLPTKPSDKIKHSQRITRTPIRYGEDEIALLLMALPKELVFRFMSLYGNSPEGFSDLCGRLLTDKHPSRLAHTKWTNKHLADTSNNISVFTHMLAAAYMGITT